MSMVGRTRRVFIGLFSVLFFTALAAEAQTVYVTKTGSKYHSAGCSYLRRSAIAMDLADAIASGYTPCSRCNPPTQVQNKAKSAPAVKENSKASQNDISDPIVYITKSGKRYHRAGCSYLKKSAIPKRLSEVIGRYEPCSRCNPPTEVTAEKTQKQKR